MVKTTSINKVTWSLLVLFVGYMLTIDNGEWLEYFVSGFSENLYLTFGMLIVVGIPFTITVYCMVGIIGESFGYPDWMVDGYESEYKYDAAMAKANNQPIPEEVHPDHVIYCGKTGDFEMIATPEYADSIGYSCNRDEFFTDEIGLYKDKATGTYYVIETREESNKITKEDSYEIDPTADDVEEFIFGKFGRSALLNFRKSL